MATVNDLKIKLKGLKNIDIHKALTKACILVETSAKELVPVDTGYLRRSITFEVDGNKGRVGTNVEYAPYVEVGTGLFSSQGNGRQTPWRYKTADNQ